MSPKTKTVKTVTKVEYELLDTVAIPLENAYKGDVGYDLVSTINRTIPTSGILAVPTGVKLKLPDNIWASIREKSGVSLKQTFSIKAGVVDPGYRGQIQVIVFNHSLDPLRINRGDKIAQVVFHEVVRPDVVETKDIDSETDRGENGFGSSDKK